MSTNHLLLIAADERLHDELRSALATMGERAPVATYVYEARPGIEMARDRSPSLILIEFPRDHSQLRGLTSELAAAAPAAKIAAAYGTDGAGASNGQVDGTAFIEGLRCGVGDFMRRPLSTIDLAQWINRMTGASSAAQRRWGTVVSFVSNKGGVGKSTLSINTAVGVAQRWPARTLLIDASLQLGVAAATLDLDSTSTIADAARERERLDETMLRDMVAVHDSGLHVLVAPRDAVEATHVDEAAVSRIVNIARRAYDFVIVDTFPMIDGVVVAVLDLSDHIYIVLENVVPTLLGGAKLLQLFNGLGFPPEKASVILNRFTNVPGSISVADTEQRLGRGVAFVLPFDPKVVTAANLGRPIAMSGNWFGFAPKLKAVVDDVASIANRRGLGDTTRIPNAEVRQ